MSPNENYFTPIRSMRFAPVNCFRVLNNTQIVAHSSKSEMENKF